MIHFSCNGKNFEEIMEEIQKRIIESNNSSVQSSTEDSCKKSLSDDDDSVHNITKCWWVSINKTDDNSQVVTYNIIAPFLIKDSFKASITTGPDQQEYLDITFQNNIDHYKNCEFRNCHVSKFASFKFSACQPQFKVIKKNIKTQYQNGIISVSIPSEKPVNKRNSEFVFGLN